MDKKIKVLTISDHPLMPSGVATQTKYFIEGLLKSGKFQVISLGGAIKHQNYQPVRTEEWKEDWTIFPVDGFGDPNIIRSLVRSEKPDILWFMTDPRFYGWLWNIANEIRPLVPMVYYHVWDNYPYPKFNKPFYNSNDVIATISKLTDDVVRTVSPEIECHYLPHAIDPNFFFPIPEEEVKRARKVHFPNMKDDTMLIFWNSRNARRKQSGAIIWWFKEFLDRVGQDRAILLMHTNPKDPNGPDLEAIVKELKLDDGRVLFSNQGVPPEHLRLMYNMADVTVSASDAEGFGLSTLESLNCGTPIIVPRTGGLQEQVTDGIDTFGVMIEPASQYVIGSQEVPYIYEDKVSGKDFKQALYNMWALPRSERKKIGQKGREHALKNYGFEDYQNKWVELMTKIYEEKGSWENRKQYQRWTLKEVK
jgi:glycosyltransferase involved in cell wall biosynthesis